MSSSTSSSSLKTQLPKLNDASEYTQWKMALQTYFFKKFKNVNMDTISDAITLDKEFFKKEFKSEWKAASKDASGNEQDQFDDPGFLHKCSEHAYTTGAGFQTWLYDTFSDIRNVLCQEINEKTAGVRLGDLKGLLDSIKLAVHHYEIFDPTDLEMKFSAATMQVEGQQDIMKYLAVLHNYMNRLKSASHPVPDTKAQRVLLRGIHQDIFEPFIRDADRRPYTSFDDLKVALLKEAARASVLTKLRDLKPGTAKGMYATTTEPVPALATRLDRMENIFAR